MKSINDFADVKIGSLVGAVGHHHYFTTDKGAKDRILLHSRIIRRKGLEEYIKSEYTDSGKNIIINNISDRLFLTDGNRHCVAMVIAEAELTIGALLKIKPDLFRYWERGYEKGASPKWQPYVTYIPIGIDVSRISRTRKGTDERGYYINIIDSDVMYDSNVFTEKDKGRTIYMTAREVQE